MTSRGGRYAATPFHGYTHGRRANLLPPLALRLPRGVGGLDSPAYRRGLKAHNQVHGLATTAIMTAFNGPAG